MMKSRTCTSPSARAITAVTAIAAIRPALALATIAASQDPGPIAASAPRTA